MKFGIYESFTVDVIQLPSNTQVNGVLYVLKGYCVSIDKINIDNIMYYVVEYANVPSGRTNASAIISHKIAVESVKRVESINNNLKIYIS